MILRDPAQIYDKIKSMKSRNWTDAEITTCIEGEKLTLKAYQQNNKALLFMASKMIDSLKNKADLFVVAYRIEKGKKYNDYNQWQKVGEMSFADYYKMLNEDTLINSRMYAFHPVNYTSLHEFDAVAL